jgi:hypothetical protein
MSKVPRLPRRAPLHLCVLLLLPLMAGQASGLLGLLLSDACAAGCQAEERPAGHECAAVCSYCACCTAVRVFLRAEGPTAPQPAGRAAIQASAEPLRGSLHAREIFHVPKRAAC